ncbi:FABP family protein [Streptomyces sp. NPDC054784]
MHDTAQPYPYPHPFPDAYAPGGTPAPHPLVAPLAALLGTWRGRGSGGYPTLDGEFDYEQEVVFRHDGRPFLQYEARAWLLGPDGAPLRPSARESGWWRLLPEGRVEALVTQPTGVAEIAVGGVTTSDGTDGGDGDGDVLFVDLVTGHVALAPTAKQVDATRRRYTLTATGTLDFTHDLAAVGQPLQHHLTARLRRVGG